MSGQSVIDGNGGYSELSFTGDPNTVVSLTSSHHQHRTSSRRATHSSSVSEIFDFSSEAILFTDSNEFEPVIVNSHDIGSQDFLDLCHPPHNQVCNLKCDCFDCSDESHCSRNVAYRTTDLFVEDGVDSSPTNDRLKPTGFWQVVKIAQNGSAKVRVPFHAGTRHQKLAVSATAITSRSVDSLRTQVLSVGSYLDMRLELPKTCKVGEHVSIKLTCVNSGSSSIRKSLRYILIMIEKV